MVGKPSEIAAVIGRLDPVSQAAATVVTTYVDMQKFKKAMFVLSVGVLGASATVDAKLRQATDSSGTGVKDITGTSMVQLTQAGTDSNKQVVFNLDAAQLDVAGEFDFATLSITVAVAACLISAVVIGINPRYGPASDSDLSTVDEIVN